MDTKLKTISRWFIVSAGILLAITGCAKIISALGKSAVLAKPDPIFGIHFNYLLLSVGLIELVVAVLCLSLRNADLALGLVAALSLNFFGVPRGVVAGPLGGILSLFRHLDSGNPSLSSHC